MPLGKELVTILHYLCTTNTRTCVQSVISCLFVLEYKIVRRKTKRPRHHLTSILGGQPLLQLFKGRGYVGMAGHEGKYGRPGYVGLTWCALHMRSMSCLARYLDTISGPKVKETPLSFSPHPITSLSGSDHRRSHSRPREREKVKLNFGYYTKHQQWHAAHTFINR